MLSNCTATTPMAMPRARCNHATGNANIAAISTSVASTPLQPASMEIANESVEELITLPRAVMLPSKTRITSPDTPATALVHGFTSHACAQGVNSTANNSASRATKTSKKRNIMALCHETADLTVQCARSLLLLWTQGKDNQKSRL